MYPRAKLKHILRLGDWCSIWNQLRILVTVRIRMLFPLKNDSTYSRNVVVVVVFLGKNFTREVSQRKSNDPPAHFYGKNDHICDVVLLVLIRHIRSQNI